MSRRSNDCRVIKQKESIVKALCAWPIWIQKTKIEKFLFTEKFKTIPYIHFIFEYIEVLDILGNPGQYDHIDKS